jgi:hypothetical protein
VKYRTETTRGRELIVAAMVELVQSTWNRPVANRHKHVGPETCVLPGVN